MALSVAVGGLLPRTLISASTTGRMRQAARDIAWRAQRRLAERDRQLGASKLALNKICAAIA